jgi:hypothetical protein
MLREERITALAAASVVALMLPGVAVAVLYPAPPTTSPEPFLAYLALHRSALLASIFLAALGWCGVLCVFAGGLLSMLRRADRANSAWPWVAFGGCIATAVAIERTRVLPRGLAFGAWAVEIIHLLSGTSLARAGMFARLGVLPSLAPLSHTAWLAAIAAVLLRRRA